MSNVFEESNMPKALILLGVPAMLGELTTLVYNLADTYFVSLTRNSTQIAAVTLCTPMLLIMMSIAIIFGMGGSSVIARLIGEGRKEDAADSFDFCFYGMIASSIVVMVFGLLFTGTIANIAGADEVNYAYTCDYLRWIFIGAPAIMLANGFVQLFRSVGLIKEATVGLVIGNGINIIFDWIFIVPMRLGARGAAMATSFGFLCATIYYISCVLIKEKQGNEYLKLSLKKLKISRNMAGNVIKIGIPGALITVMLSVPNIVLNNNIGTYGSNAVASYGIAYKIDLFPIMLSVGFSQGVAPLLGYYFGKQDSDRLSKAMRLGMLYELLLGIFFTVVTFTGSKMLASIFLHDEELVSMTGLFLRLLCFHAPFLGIINMITAYFQALGKAVNSLIITILRNIVLFIPGAFLLNYFFGLHGVLLTQLIVEIVLSGISLVMYISNLPKNTIQKSEGILQPAGE